jgi:hypothetical protein
MKRNILKLLIVVGLVVAAYFIYRHSKQVYVKAALIEAIDRVPQDWERGSHFMREVEIWKEEAKRNDCFSEVLPDIAARIFNKNYDSRHRSFDLLLSIGDEAAEILPILEDGRSKKTLTKIEKEEVDYLIDAIRRATRNPTKATGALAR